MAGVFTFKVDGVAALTQRMQLLTADLRSEVKAEIGFAADDLAARAKADAPADQGFLRNAVSTFSVDTEDSVSSEVVVQNEYAAFVEFGTGAKFQAEPEFEAYASQFRNQSGSGTFSDMVSAIAAWIGRKGIAGTYSSGVKKVKGGGFALGGATGKRRGSRINQIAENYSIAYAIAVSILRDGLTPHPFLFKNFDVVQKNLIQNVKNVLFKIVQ